MNLPASWIYLGAPETSARRADDQPPRPDLHLVRLPETKPRRPQPPRQPQARHPLPLRSSAPKQARREPTGRASAATSAAAHSPVRPQHRLEPPDA
jgi:hypothetical protein